MLFCLGAGDCYGQKFPVLIPPTLQKPSGTLGARRACPAGKRRPRADFSRRGTDFFHAGITFFTFFPAP
ncbi:hypothetical protein DW219_04085 [Desulfovibrio sp. AM18-2]|nr:hypothetical protein DW219_04085 [Desulfovibrio sp. AM18-2]CAI3217210.1 hypothetical protein DWUX_15 [Desulfovibrio diazotrophicus]